MTTTYTISQWIFFFCLYSFIGWCYESTYVSIKEKKYVNRGFMRGPFLPLYGSGAVVMLVVTIPFRDNILLTFIAGAIGATLMEYVTGVIMETLFKIRYWDYSEKKFNFQGHICLAATILWGAFTVLLSNVIHKPIEHFVLMIPYRALRYIVAIVGIIVVSDFSIAFKTALDIRDVLVRMDRIREELIRIQKRVDIILAFAEDAKDTTIQFTSEKAGDIIENLEGRFKRLKEVLPKLELSDERKEELWELRTKLRIHKEGRFQISHAKDFHRKQMIKDNPGMISVRFKEALEELKDVAMGNKKEDKKEKDE